MLHTMLYQEHAVSDAVLIGVREGLSASGQQGVLVVYELLLVAIRTYTCACIHNNSPHTDGEHTST